MPPDPRKWTDEEETLLSEIQAKMPSATLMELTEAFNTKSSKTRTSNAIKFKKMRDKSGS
jgi:hypothetical protein